MNKLFAIFIFLFLANVSWSQRNFYITGYTRVEVGYPHAESYQKECASFALEQAFSYPINRHFSVGLGTGFALYPAAYTIPAFFKGTFRIPIKNKSISWDHRIGMNLKVGQNSFFGYRYNTTLHYSIRLNRKMLAFAGVGANFLWDEWSDKSLSGALHTGIIYTVFNGQRLQTKKGPAPPRENNTW
ncbi:MAG: hypothetical protein Crog4KO_15950 [Crocinitomicaceae bacterium]